MAVRAVLRAIAAVATAAAAASGSTCNISSRRRKRRRRRGEGADAAVRWANEASRAAPQGSSRSGKSGGLVTGDADDWNRLPASGLGFGLRFGAESWVSTRGLEFRIGVSIHFTRAEMLPCSALGTLGANRKP